MFSFNHTTMKEHSMPDAADKSSSMDNDHSPHKNNETTTASVLTSGLNSEPNTFKESVNSSTSITISEDVNGSMTETPGLFSSIKKLEIDQTKNNSVILVTQTENDSFSGVSMFDSEAQLHNFTLLPSEKKNVSEKTFFKSLIISLQNETTKDYSASMVNSASTEFPILSNTSNEESKPIVENGLGKSESNDIEKIEIFSGSSNNETNPKVTTLSLFFIL